MQTVEKLRNDDYKAIREFVYERSGLFFSDAKLYFIENRVSKRLKSLGMTRYQDYLRHIKSPANADEMNHLFDAVTTNETSFYRNPPQIDAFADHILPKVVESIRARGQRTLKIWSSACSSGEEPYTLAMVLLEKKDLLRGLIPRVYGSDISVEILAKAKEATYQAYTMRNLPPNYKKSYFEPKGNEFGIASQVRNMVQLSQFNLVDYKSYIKFRSMDIIFCRNVLIYFDLKVKRQIIKNFFDCLNNQSFLLIGHSESLHNINRDFKLEHFSRALAYLKSV
ncbi:Protein-glutamate O-methyltransferase [Sulfidibacter corallicola]|uniref:protein-glutamate O-methyltransferase n=1 Tax=Sulfidibacter corallicola TaxID=2818388 RepID=A0A8A4TQH8_SULCO|nr:CheR family methyltransferase [Sulfidibacter corallicola]QTD52219.1 hypothetical protein J3U87_07075 [Sulfidibacter corallicola]